MATPKITKSVRFDVEVHRWLEKTAKIKGISINEFINRVLYEKWDLYVQNYTKQLEKREKK